MNLKPYKPTHKQPWNLRRVWMLHRRTGFGATWQELQRDLADGPSKSIDRIIRGQTRIVGVPDDFTEMRKILASSAVASDRPERLIAWWIYQMYFSPDPFRERMAIMWHNHFATSNAKVKNLHVMFEQNEIFRQQALGKFPLLLSNTLKHTAMLKWLDGDQNRVGKANENLGRETLELFTLGLGNYTEADVKNASRALTGWSVKDKLFRVRDDWHDKENKIILGQEGNFDGDDLIDITTRHSATAKRLAWRMSSEFLSKSVVTEELIDQLAGVLKHSSLDVGVTMEALLRSEAFFSNANLKRRIVAPESFVVGTVRAMNIFEPPASTMVLGDWLEQLGRKLFYPPNVGGWPGGKGWLNSRTTIARANFGAALVNGNLRRDRVAPDLMGLAKLQTGSTDTKQTISYFCSLLTGMKTEKTIDELHEKASEDKTTQEDILRGAVKLILASPQAQLC